MHIFCDFDGTISAADTTDLLLRRLAAPHWEAIEAEWEAGAIDAAACMRAQVALIEATPFELDAVLDTVTLRPGFVAFARWTEREGLPLTVVSDGIDYVIHAVLARHGLRLPVIANRLVVAGVRRYALEQPHARAGCGSGVCKCAVIDAVASRRPIVFIGDGRSDFCVSARPDLLFATGRLIAHCAAERTPFMPFDTFDDVRAALESIRRPVTALAA